MAGTIYRQGSMSKADVKNMQQALIDAGYSVGSTGADGIWGSNTAAALSQFKKDTGGSNTYGNSVGDETFKKLYGTSSSSSSKSTSSSSSSSSKGTTSSSSKGTTSSSAGTSFTEKKGSSSVDQLVNNYSELAKQFNAQVGNKIASAQSKGQKVYSGYDNNGVLHYTTKGQDRLNSILDYYNSSSNPTYDIGGVNYVVDNTAPVVKTVNSKNGNRDANVTYRADGTVDVSFSSPTYSAVGDYIIEDDNTYIYYVSDPEHGTYWTKGTAAEYEQYVANYGQDAEWLAMQAQLEAMEEELLQRTQEANQAGVDLSIAEIEAELENGVGQYGQDAEEAYLQKLRAQQSQQLQNAYQGDLGGIGNKQYNEASASYDSAMLQIALEKENFVNSCNQQINQLKAQGRLQDAEILAEWAQAKIDRYDADYKWYQELKFSKEQMANDQANIDREYYYNRAVDMLERGALTEDALEVLGVDGAWAKKYADLINDSASYSLSYAKAQLDNLLADTALTKANTSAVKAETAALKKSSTTSSGGSENGTVRINYADGSFVDAPLDENGEIPESFLKDGAYITDDEGVNHYYNPKTGELQTEVPKTAKTYNAEDWLKAYASLTGDTSTSKASSAKSALEAALADAVAKRDAVAKQMKSLTANQNDVYGSNNRGEAATPVVPVKNQMKYDALRKQYDSYDRQAGSYATLLGKYPG